MIPSTSDLLRIIDTLWAELPVDVAIRLVDEQPTLVDQCREIHDHVSHDDH